jgi:adenosylmethionine-8-amino-7-oxononanoate aminotransferase
MSDASHWDRDTVWQKDRAHFVHPWTLFDSFSAEGSLVITEGHGVFLKDANGKRYIDGVGGLWCTNVGLGRDEMADAIAAQVKRLAYSNPFVDMTNAPAAELADRLAALAPGDLNHVIYGTSGSTAVDTAYRLIQYYQNCRGLKDKKHIIARKEGYHGSTFIAMSIGAKTIDRIPEFDFLTQTFHHISCPNHYRAPHGVSEPQYCDLLVRELEEKILAVGPEKVAAFFAEPVMGAGGVVVPPVGYNRRTWEICRKYDVLYVADEIVTAFGRLGHWFASKDVFGVEPDIITCAKGLSSGYLPISATVFSDAIYEIISAPGHGRYFAHGFTYAGHPVCCAAALKNIEIIERDQLLERVREIGPYFQSRLRGLADCPLVGDVRGLQLMLCIENVASKRTKEEFPDAIGIGKRISNACEQRGLLVRPVGHLNVLSPALIVSREQIDTMADILREAEEAVASDLKKEGLWDG